jgi:hypothetical protein
MYLRVAASLANRTRFVSSDCIAVGLQKQDCPPRSPLAKRQRAEASKYAYLKIPARSPLNPMLPGEGNEKVGSTSLARTEKELAKRRGQGDMADDKGLALLSAHKQPQQTLQKFSYYIVACESVILLTLLTSKRSFSRKYALQQHLKLLAHAPSSSAMTAIARLIVSNRRCIT